ncbi:MAG: FAD-dependent oxidoreductase [Deltaproteobacteria bacterium]|nr:FAD-dependent oxidoreductase [Deltaproteobacteria bacterium]
MLDLSAWPPELRDRARVLVDADPARADSGFVLYWMRIAARDHDNPALEAAITAADALGKTVLVYHGVSERYPYACDRHHTFILEGARDVARGLRRRGVGYALHVERPGSRGPVLRQLAERAALVITEDAPFPPLAAWTSRLAGHLADRRVPFVAVDASCVVPMPLVTKRHDRAFTFRNATKRIAAESLAQVWRDRLPARPPVLPPLPFTPVDAESLDDRAISRLVAACDIDHAVGPVRTLRGGSVAGYARWDSFRASGLARYAERRNDAALDGTSRLSPWLHFGHVSPFRIAREVAALPPSASRDKFLDELLIWREVAWHFAAHTPQLETLDALPAWARATLDAHQDDPRQLVSLERLERGRTGDRLWDLAQRSLLVHGELHNNLRMTWGKAIAGWTRSPEAARRTLVALNHRYALDGRDPASYGGLYWCLGLFDRPFSPEQPVLGAVRPRPTSVHAGRLDLEAYAARLSRPSRSVGRVAVVGAGVAGLACARTLVDHGVDVTIFDKGRTPGGRLASHRAPDLDADLGAPYFTVRDERFSRLVRSWIDDGVVEPWRGRIRALPSGQTVPVETPPLERFVGTPGMSAIARHLARDLEVRTGHRVDRIERVALPQGLQLGLNPGPLQGRGRRFALAGTVGEPGVTLGPRAAEDPTPLVSFGEFDALVVCLPADQALPLVRDCSPTLAEAVARVTLEPCLALALVPESDALSALPFDGLFVGRDGDPARILSWLARESSKPRRRSVEAWVIHAAPEWSRAHLRDAQEAIVEQLLAEASRLLQLPRFGARATTLRRWAFARAPSTTFEAALFDDDVRLGVGGDWSAGGRVEGAFLAGIALAGRVLGS